MRRALLGLEVISEVVLLALCAELVALRTGGHSLTEPVRALKQDSSTLAGVARKAEAALSLR